MAKIKIWIAKNINGGPEIKKKSLKDLCVEIGLSYNTAKKKLRVMREGKSGYRFRWASETVIYDLWREEI